MRVNINADYMQQPETRETVPLSFRRTLQGYFRRKLYKFVSAIIETQKHVHSTLLKKKNF